MFLFRVCACVYSCVCSLCTRVCEMKKPLVSTQTVLLDRTNISKRQQSDINEREQNDKTTNARRQGTKEPELFSDRPAVASLQHVATSGAPDDTLTYFLSGESRLFPRCRDATPARDLYLEPALPDIVP